MCISLELIKELYYDARPSKSQDLFFLLLYNFPLLCSWRLALSIVVEVFPWPFFPDIAPSKMFTTNSLCLIICPIHDVVKARNGSDDKHFLDFYRLTMVNAGIYRQNLEFTKFRAFTVTYIQKDIGIKIE